MRYITEIFYKVLQGIKSLILTSTDPGNKHTADIATNILSLKTKTLVSFRNSILRLFKQVNTS